MTRRWWEGAAIAVPLVAGALWLGVSVRADERAGAPRRDPVAVEAWGPAFTSLDELRAASDLIVLGEVTGVAEGRTITAPGDPAAGIRTRLLTVEVTRALQGAVPSVVVVEEEAALLDGTPIVVNGMAPGAVGDRGVYFLVAGSDPAAPYHAVVNEQGRYLVDGVQLRPAAADDPLAARLAALGLNGLVAAVLGD